MTKQEIEVKIEANSTSIKRIQDSLPWADHGAYGQDLKRIREYQEENAQLRARLATLTLP